MTRRSDDYRVPSWAQEILFWRKVLEVRRRGIPGSLNRPSEGAEGSSRS